MSQWLSELLSQLIAQSVAEFIAVGLAIGYVWLAAKQNIWCWACAAVSTAIFTFIFWEVSLPFQSLLNVYYLIMAAYGWWKWQSKDNELTTTSWSVKAHCLTIAALSVISLLLIQLGGALFDSDYLYLDVFITVFSVFATYMMAQKVLENWLYWIVIDSFAAYLYIQKDLHLTGVLFLGYFVFSVYGYLSWKNDKTLMEATG